MKRLLAFLVLALAVAATAYGVTRYLGARAPEDQWTWLRREFHLSDAQFARVRALHEAYQPICAGHCSRILAVQHRLDELERTAAKDSPAYLVALKEWAELKRECNEATLQHLRRVAGAMDPDQGSRYLALMVPRLTRFDHRAPRGVR